MHTDLGGQTVDGLYQRLFAVHPLWYPVMPGLCGHRVSQVTDLSRVKFISSSLTAIKIKLALELECFIEGYNQGELMREP